MWRLSRERIARKSKRGLLVCGDDWGITDDDSLATIFFIFFIFSPGKNPMIHHVARCYKINKLHNLSFFQFWYFTLYFRSCK